MPLDKLRLPAALAGLFVLNAQAADPQRLETLTVTVTAPAEEDRLPLAVSKVKADEQPSPSQQSLQDFLQPVPGLFALNNDNAAQGLRVSIRGFGARAAFGVRGIRVLVDGVPLTLPDGQTDLDALDLGLLESAQVVRGPSAALFGNAAGGAIMLQTRAASETPQGRLDVRGGSFDNRRIRLEGSNQFGDTGMLGAYTEADSRGPREHADTDTRLLNARLDRAWAGGRLQALVSSLDITSQDPGGLTGAQAERNRRSAAPGNLQFDAGETIEQQRVSLSWSGPVRGWALQTTGYVGQRDFANRLPFTDGGQVIFDRNLGGIGSTLSRVFEGPWTQHRFSTGLDIQFQQDDRARFDNNDGTRGVRTLAQDEKATSAGVFIRDTLALGSKWEASLGLRHDSLDLEVDDRFLSDGNDSGQRDIDNTSADISLTHWLEQGMLYVRLATSFETPTFTELANPAGGGFNDNLESTEALNREIGFKGDWQDLHYSLALFRVDVEDELVPFEIAAQPGRRFFRNAGKTSREGVELAAGYDINTAWHLDTSASYGRYRFDNGPLRGNHLPGIPEQTAWLGIHHRNGPWRTALLGSYTGELYADDANTEEVSGYGLLHVQAKYRAGSHWTLETAIDNLLDREYNDNIRINAFGGRFFEPAGGRTYRIGIRLSI